MAEDSDARGRTATAAGTTANVYETPDGAAYVIEVPVPGLTRQEIAVEVDVGTITVRTEPARTDIDTDNVRVILEQGLLRIRAPKAAAGRPRVVKVAPEK